MKAAVHEKRQLSLTDLFLLGDHDSVLRNVQPGSGIACSYAMHALGSRGMVLPFPENSERKLASHDTASALVISCARHLPKSSEIAQKRIRLFKVLYLGANPVPYDVH